LQHQPAERKGIILRALYGFKVARLVDEPSQNFKRQEMVPLICIKIHVAGRRTLRASPPSAQGKRAMVPVRQPTRAKPDCDLVGRPGRGMR
jgi:hypothetical protein